MKTSILLAIILTHLDKLYTYYCNILIKNFATLESSVMLDFVNTY